MALGSVMYSCPSKLPVDGLLRITVRQSAQFLQDIESHQRHDAVAIGRQLADIIAMVPQLHRRHPFCPVGSKVYFAQGSARPA